MDAVYSVQNMFINLLKVVSTVRVVFMIPFSLFKIPVRGVLLIITWDKILGIRDNKS